VPPSPAGLLEVPRGQRLVHDLLEYADLVVFDCAPLSVGAEAAVVCSWADGALVMVDLSTSEDRGVRDAVRRLEAVQADILGLVVNRDRLLEPSAYDYYHSTQVTPGAATSGSPERDPASSSRS
jgi:Mrp family chromosome partitioning ATPase